MTPVTQTLITLICMVGAYIWGTKRGFNDGILATAQVLVERKILKEEDLHKLFNIEQESDDE